MLFDCGWGINMARLQTRRDLFINLYPKMGFFRCHMISIACQPKLYSLLLPCIRTRALVSDISSCCCSRALISSSFIKHQPQRPLKPLRLPDLSDLPADTETQFMATLRSLACIVFLSEALNVHDLPDLPFFDILDTQYFPCLSIKVNPKLDFYSLQV